MPLKHPARWKATAVLVAFLSVASALFLLISKTSFAENSGAESVDLSVKPGDDFYRYANGLWLKSVSAAGRASYDNRALLTERTSQRVRELIEQASATPSAQGAITQQVGDYYFSFTDENSIAAKELAPLARELAAISAISGNTSLSACLGATLNTESDGLTANADHIFGLWVSQGFHDAKRAYPHLMQGGLGMSSRDPYIDSSPQGVDARAKYQAHIGKMLQLAGVADIEAKSQRVLSLEVAIAQAFVPDPDANDAFKQNNVWKRADFAAKAPGIDWDAYFEAAGLAQQPDFVVWHPGALTGISALVHSESLESWKDYLAFHRIEHYAGVLPEALFAEHAAFAGQPGDRKSAAIVATNGALGQAVGQIYVQRYFPPAAKAKAESMKRNLLAAYRARLTHLDWMSPATRQKAIAKLDALTLGVGYPEKWIDYSSLRVVRGDAFGNLQRAEAFQRARNLAQLQQPANAGEWRIDPQTVGAVIVFSPNSEFFAAGILQPPYFDPQGDNAANYGSAGAGMAHEITHSFDELGNIYDAEGRLGLWWTGADRAQYRAAAASLEAQLAAYCPFPGLCLDGKRVLGESAADLAGLQVAHDAYLLSLQGQPDVMIGGLTGEQRFFVAFARRWRRAQSEAALRKQLATDTHAPGEYRSAIVRNLESWRAAFRIAPTDNLYLDPAKRVSLW